METMRKKLYDVLPIVNWSNISKDYFGKSRAWLYQKMSGTDVNGNGRPFDFNDDEREILKKSLEDIARRISDAAARI